MKNAIRKTKLLENYNDVCKSANDFADLLYSTDLPQVYSDAWSSNLYPLVKSSVYLKNGSFGLWEGLGFCGLHTTDITYHASFPLISLFPDLHKKQMKMGAGYPRDILIANNEISYAPYTGISVGFGWSSDDNAMRNNRILNNEIHHTSQVLCDAGGIYTLSKQPDSEMSGNYIHDIVLPEWADYGTNGIYMDEQTSGYTVKKTTLWKMHIG